VEIGNRVSDTVRVRVQDWQNHRNPEARGYPQEKGTAGQRKGSQKRFESDINIDLIVFVSVPPPLYYHTIPSETFAQPRPRGRIINSVLLLPERQQTFLMERATRSQQAFV